LTVTWPPNKDTSSMFYYAYTSCFKIHTPHSRRACHLLRGHGLYDYDLFSRSTQQIRLDVEIFKTKFLLNWLKKGGNSFTPLSKVWLSLN
jgi:hypothetical protein